jgi:hypothetical protein
MLKKKEGRESMKERKKEKRKKVSIFHPDKLS